jgi:hypothetical protein
MFSLGLVRRSAKISLVLAPLVIAAYVVGLPYGPNGVATAFSVALLIWLLPHVVWCVHGTPISVRDLASAVARPLLATAFAAALAYAAQHYAAGLPHALLRLAAGGAVMLAAYLFALMFILGQKDTYLELLRGLRSPAIDSKS